MPHPANKLAAKERLGDFEIVKELGCGGMGIVYEARQVSLNRQVALKVLSAGLGLTGKAVQRFQREAEAAAKLHHTNIVPIYATGEQDGTYFYAMELIEGQSLDRVIRQARAAKNAPGHAADAAATPAAGPHLAATGPFVPEAAGESNQFCVSSSSLGSDSHYFDTVARMLAEVADALEHAHSQSVIHRDIKPSNLLLSSAGRLSISDFGLARLQEQPGMTLSGEFVGTPRYMSPEQIAAGRTPIDHRTDIYSLGATLYELLTLFPPFRGEGRDQVLAQILHKEPVPPRKLDKNVPVDLQTICLKALEKDPDRRYQTAGQMADDLRRFLNRFAILAKRAGPVERLHKWVRRRPALAAALAGIVVLAVAAGLFALRAYRVEQDRLAEKLRHDEELLEVNRQNSLERAILAAMGGQLDAAEKAIYEAERLKASPGEIRLLRGQIALYSGKPQEAIDHLEKAAALMPKSAAAQGALSVAFCSVGPWEKWLQPLRELEQLTPKSPLDFMFKAWAEGAIEPGKALKTLEMGFGASPPILARLVRADIGWQQALATGQVVFALRAVEDAEAAKRALPGNPAALYPSTYAALAAATLYDAAGLADKSKDVLAQAGKDAEALKPFAQIPEAVLARWYYYRHIDQEKDVLDELRKVCELTNHSQAAFYYALALYRHRELHGAFEFVQPRSGKVNIATVRILINAEAIAAQTGDPEKGLQAGLKAYEELQALGPKGLEKLSADGCLYYLNRPEQAAETAKTLLGFLKEIPTSVDIPGKEMLEYVAGLATEQQFLAATPGPLGAIACSNYCTMGLKKLGEGDRVGAREAFRKSVASRVFNIPPYEVSLAFFLRLEADPTWPPWIPVKKD